MHRRDEWLAIPLCGWTEPGLQALWHFLTAQRIDKETDYHQNYQKKQD